MDDMMIQHIIFRCIIFLAIIQVFSAANIRCGAGTEPKIVTKDSTECVACPSGKYSKGDHSKCKICRKCKSSGVKTPCTLTTNTVCIPVESPKLTECQAFFKNNQTNLFRIHCTQTGHLFKKIQCRERGTCFTEEADQMENSRKDPKNRKQKKKKKVASVALFGPEDNINLAEDEEEEGEEGDGDGETAGLERDHTNVSIILITSVLVLSVCLVAVILLLIQQKNRKTTEARVAREIRGSDDFLVPRNPHYDSVSLSNRYVNTPNATVPSQECMMTPDISDDSNIQPHDPLLQNTAYSRFDEEMYTDPHVRSTENFVSPRRNETSGMYMVRPIRYNSCEIQGRLDSTTSTLEDEDETSVKNAMLTFHPLDAATGEESLCISDEDENGYEPVGQEAYQSGIEELTTERTSLLKESTFESYIEYSPRNINNLTLICHRPVSVVSSTLISIRPDCPELSPDLEQTEVTESRLYDDCDVVPGGTHGNGDEDPNYASTSESDTNQYYPVSYSGHSTYYISSEYDDTKPVTFKEIKNQHPVKDVNLRANHVDESTSATSDNQTISSGFGEELDNNDVHDVTNLQPTRSLPNGLEVVITSSKQTCKPENLHETLFKTESTQTRQNCENLQTIFGQKFDVLKYFTSEGGKLTKSNTNMVLTVPPDSICEGETVLVGGRFTGSSLDVLPYLEAGWVVISPLAEFEMTYRKRWDKHVKIYLPYYTHNPKEQFKVCFYHRKISGELEFGSVPQFDSTKSQDMYYVKKSDHVEISTVIFTLFHCACDHKLPLFMTVSVFTSYKPGENEATVRVHVGDNMLADPLVNKELEQKEKTQYGTTLKMSKDLRLLQRFDSNSKLVFELDFPKNKSDGQNNQVIWENIFQDQCPSVQERRFSEMVKCTNPSTEDSLAAASAIAPTSTTLSASSSTSVSSTAASCHQCHAEIEWIYAPTVVPPPDCFSCTVKIQHDPEYGEAERHGACQEGVTWLRLKSSAETSGLSKKREDLTAEQAIGELPSLSKTNDPYSALHH